MSPYERFWRPVFVHLMRRGNLSPEQAAEQTRTFFIRLAQSPPQSNLREFIKAKLADFSPGALEEHPDFPPLSPTEWPAIPEGEEVFDKEWAWCLLSESLYELKGKLKDAEYKALAHCVLADAPKTFAQCAHELGIKTEEARSWVFLARGKLRAILWRRVQETVGSRAEVDAELTANLKVFEP